MANQFAEKLRLTAQVLGCVTHKELCVRFHAVNPQTLFQLGNSYKWMSGRATPRSSGVYTDWSNVLQVGRSGQFLADCSLDEFRQLLATRYDFALDEVADADEASIGVSRLLQGFYAVYSPAWSRAARGAVIRGSLVFRASDDGQMLARYSERIPGSALNFKGRCSVVQRSLHLHLDDPVNGSTLFLCFHAPVPPGNVLLGLMAGSAFHDPQTRPTAVRALGVRQIGPDTAMRTPNRYLGSPADEILQDVEDLGYDTSRASDIGHSCTGFLWPEDGAVILDVPIENTEDLIMRFNYLLAPQGAEGSNR